MNEPAPDEESLADEVARCLEQLETGGEPALAQFLTDHPHAEALRERIAILRDSGLVAPGAEPRIAGYRLEYGLGAGGVGEVWAARDEERQRDVALKMLRADRLGAPSLVERMHREVAVLKRLAHPVIVPVLDAGDSSYGPWFAMPRVDGVPLDRLLEVLPEPRQAMSTDTLAQAFESACGLGPDPDRGVFRLPFAAAIAAMGSSLADALACAHDAGVLHRDVKPSNVILTPEGEVRLIDFGLARDEERTRMTHSGAPLGSLAYMPPEQREGSADVDARSDLYALGATLHELLIGIPPRVSRTGDSSRGSRPDPALAPGGLDTVVEACLRPRPEHRYPDAAALREDLRRFVAGSRPRPPRIPWSHRLRQGLRRHPVLTVLGGLAVGGLIAFGANTALRDDPPRFDEARAHDVARRLADIEGDILQGQTSWRSHAGILRAALELYGPRLQGDPRAIPDTVLERGAATMTSLACINVQTGRNARARERAERAEVLLQESIRRQGRRGPTLARLGNVRFVRGRLALDRSDFAKADARYAEADALFDEARPGLAKNSQKLAVRRRLALATDRAALAERRRRTKEAEAHTARALEMIEEAGVDRFYELSMRVKREVFRARRGVPDRDGQRATLAEELATMLETISPSEEGPTPNHLRAITALTELCHTGAGVLPPDRHDALFLRLISLRRSALAARPDDYPARVRLATALLNYGELLRRDKPDAARARLEEALSLLGEQARDPDESFDAASTRALVQGNLAASLGRGETERRGELLNRALATLRHHAARRPDDVELHCWWAGTLHNRSNLEWDLGERDASMATLAEAIEVQQAISSRFPEDRRAAGQLWTHARVLAGVHLNQERLEAGGRILRALDGAFRHHPPIELQRATMLLRADETEAAIAGLVAAVKSGFRFLDRILARPPWSAHADRPEFRELLSGD